MLAQGSRAFGKRGRAPPFGWGGTTRLEEDAGLGFGAVAGEVGPGVGNFATSRVIDSG